VGTGTWTQTAGTGTVAIADSTSASTLITAPDFGVYRFTWSEDNGRGCTDSNDVVITFNVQPVPAFTPDTSGCTPLTVAFSNQSAGGTGYLWDFEDGGTSALTEPENTFINTGTSDKIFNIKLIVSNGGCSDSITHDVLVHPLPDANFTSGATPGCGPMIVHFTNLSTGSVQHIWNYGDSSPPDTVYTPDHVFVNDTTFIQVFQVWLTAVSTYGCRDSTARFIEIYPQPDVSLTAVPDSACHPAVVNFFAPPWASSYSWVFGDGTYDNTSGASVVHTYYNMGTQDTIYNISLTAVSPLGCAESDTHAVVVHPKPAADFSSSQYTGCTPFSVELINSSAGAVSFYWNFGNGAMDTTYITDTANLVYTYINSVSNPVSYDIRMVAESEAGCRDTMIHSINVFPEVTAAVDADTAGCSPLIVHFINLSAGAIAYAWNFGDGVIASAQHPVHTFVNPADHDTSFIVSMTALSAYGCTDTAFHTVTVHAKPDANFMILTDEGCSPYTLSVMNQSVGADSYYWQFGDGDTAATGASVLQHTYTNLQSSPVFYELNLIVANSDGCYDSLAKTITVFPVINAAFTSDTAGCHPYTVNFLNQSSGASFYHWDFGDSLVSALLHPSHVFSNESENDTVYTVTLIAISVYSCSDTAGSEITVFPKPDATFQADTTTGCSPFTVNVTQQAGDGNNFLWNFGDGYATDTSATAFEHIYENITSTAVNHQIEFIVTNTYACSDSMNIPVTVFPDVKADFEYDSAGCSPLTISFLNQSTGASSWQWDFGDGGTSANTHPGHLYNNPDHLTDTTYYITLVAISSYLCSDTSAGQVVVYPVPVAEFTLSGSSGCTPFNAAFTNLSLGADTCLWNFGDGVNMPSTDTEIEHVYTNSLSVPDEYPVTLAAVNFFGCSSIYAGSVTVYPDVTAGFTCDSAGCSPYSVVFGNQSYGAGYYEWDFGDGSSSGNTAPSHTFETYGDADTTYDIAMIASSQYGCSDTASSRITVYPAPEASFTATPVSQMYPDTTVTIVNNSSTGNWTYSWSFGNGTISGLYDPVTVNYTTWGVYDITLLVSGSHCSDEATASVEILPPPPVADFDSSTSGCAPLTVRFSNNSYYAETYFWTFGDGYTSTHKEPTHTYYTAGTYMVTLQVTGPGGQDYVSDAAIGVFPVPEAHFTVGPRLVYLPDQPVHCYNLSEGAVSWIWDFGDGNTSQEFSPTHYYTQEGTYDISLRVASDHDCRDSALLEKAVTAEKSGDIVFPDAFTPNPEGATGGYYQAGDYSNDIFYPAYKGIEEYHLQVFNRWGELIFESFDAEIGWDGYYRGELCKQDVYVWKVSGKYINGNIYVDAGDVTLLR
ncbi:MAG: PKD domain-containing protein, partial [Bacteroidetes bacterium]|nr:PKD domain-containing protein [Bacteroidota bacterium]